MIGRTERRRLDQARPVAPDGQGARLGMSRGKILIRHVVMGWLCTPSSRLVARAEEELTRTRLVAQVRHELGWSGSSRGVVWQGQRPEMVRRYESISENSTTSNLPSPCEREAPSPFS